MPKASPSKTTHRRRPHMAIPLPAEPTPAERFMKQRIHFLEDRVDELDAAYQDRCAEIKALYAALSRVRAALRQKPPSIALALSRLSDALD